MKPIEATWKWNLSSQDFSRDSIGKLKIEKMN